MHALAHSIFLLPQLPAGRRLPSPGRPPGMKYCTRAEIKGRIWVGEVSWGAGDPLPALALPVATRSCRGTLQAGPGWFPGWKEKGAQVPTHIPCFPGPWAVSVGHTRARPKEQWLTWGAFGGAAGVSVRWDMGVCGPRCVLRTRGAGPWVWFAPPVPPDLRRSEGLMRSAGLPGWSRAPTWHLGSWGAGQRGEQHPHPRGAPCSEAGGEQEEPC